MGWLTGWTPEVVDWWTGDPGADVAAAASGAASAVKGVIDTPAATAATVRDTVEIGGDAAVRAVDAWGDDAVRVAEQAAKAAEAASFAVVGLGMLGVLAVALANAKEIRAALR